MKRDLLADDGFSLLEVVIALAILSLSLSAVFPIFGQAPSALERAREDALALQLATNQLAAAELKTDCFSVPIVGERNGWSWEVAARPYENENVSSVPAFPCHLTTRVWRTAKPERLLAEFQAIRWVANH